MLIEEYLSKQRKLIDRALMRHVPKGSEHTRILYGAVKYSLLSGGKRIRPILALEACSAVSGTYQGAIPLAVAIEMIHTYTLIHDDLPAMDDDDMRRGKPTCHKVFGDDVAILAGDLLNTLAFEVIARSYGNKAGLIIKELAIALGIDGVVGGQVADLRPLKKDIKTLRFISERKTASLFLASVRCGAIAGGATKGQLAALSSYARHLGLAFQIIDDILDYGSEKKNNYPVLLGLKRSKLEAEKEAGLAIAALPKGKSYNRLRNMAAYLTKRRR